MNFVKQRVKRYTDTNLVLRILIGMIIGIILALVVPSWTFLTLFGDVFVGALKGVAPVLVFVLISSSLAAGQNKLDRKFGYVLMLYMVSTFLAAAVAVIGSFLFPQTLVLTEAATADVVPEGIGEVLKNLLLNVVSNPIASVANANYIGILFWAVLFGLAMKKIAESYGKTLMVNISDSIAMIVRWIINLAPFGIMGLVFQSVSTNGIGIFKTYGSLLALLVGCMLLVALVVDPLMAAISSPGRSNH